MLSKLPPLLSKAKLGQYAIPAVNATNLETVQAIIRAAVIAKSPVIVQTSESALAYAGRITILKMIETLAISDGKGVPVVTHLDHGKHLNIVKQCIDSGYQSVHIDGSEKSWKQNVAVTKRAVFFARQKNISVQGELGYLLGYEGMTKSGHSRKRMEKFMTDPDQAKEFVRLTGVDTLGIAIGTAHGAFKGKEKIDFKRLSEIYEKVLVPLVLHGGSGVSAVEIKKSISAGIRIINIDTSLRFSFLHGLMVSLRHFKSGQKLDVREPLEKARLTMQKEAIKIMKLFGSAGKA